ncbi:Nucleotidyltransferase domain protein [uncultured archaeon]|nr:Nucleotidyltransferase domain protein [uncultured archaeon]
MTNKLPKVELIELNEAYGKIMQWFFSYPTIPISLSDLAKELSISKKTANRIVLQLIKEEFLIKEEIGKTWRISCNQKHIYNFTRKISYNLSLVYQVLYEAGIINEISKIVGNPKVIVLFGSYRKGDDTDKSDIDLAIEIAGNEELRIVHLGNLPSLGYRKNVPVNLHIFSRNKIDLNLFSNIANGIVLAGFLEVRI